MKKNVLILYTLLISFFSQAQEKEKILKEYNFKNGKYSLVLSKPINVVIPKLIDSTILYSKDIEMLIEVQNDWEFKPIPSDPESATDLVLHVCKNGLIKRTYNIDLKKSKIKFGRYFDFENNLISIIENKFEPGIVHIDTFPNIDSARIARKLFINDTNYLTSLWPLWDIYDGSFGIAYPYPDSSSSLIEIKKTVSKEIKKNYPNEKFELEEIWSNSDGHGSRILIVSITCDKTLKEKFKLYPIPRGFEWELFDPILTSFWIN